MSVAPFTLTVPQSWPTGIGSVRRRILNQLLPLSCGTCGIALTDDPLPFICRRCWAQITPLPQPRCPRCGIPFASPLASIYSPDHTCRSCRRHKPSYTRAWSLFPYESSLRNLVHLLKYRKKIALGSVLGRLMCEHLPALPEIDLVMPVPLARQRLLEREYNQSLLLADPISRAIGKPLDWCSLVRVRPRTPQTALPRRARLKNLRRTFAVANPAQISGRRVLLVDDVFTTGTTVNECAKALRKAGSDAVFVVTLARTL
ncbi:MAG: ComF family protein [Nitrospiraceae bacterium]